MLRRVVRSPFVFWLGVSALAATTGLVVSSSLGRAGAAAARYGSLRPATVARRAMSPGERLSAADVVVRQVPASFLPAGSLASTDAVQGRTVIVPVFPGEPVLNAHLAPSGRRGLAALLPPGRQAVAVPVEHGGIKTRRGDVVDVLATFDRTERDGEDPTFPVATGAVVIDAGDESVTVAVMPDEARRVAFAVAKGTTALALTALPSPPR